MVFLASFLIALVLCGVLIPPLIRWAPQMHMIDVPSPRRVHTHPIPRIGGVAIVFGTLLPILIWLPMSQKIIPIVAGISVLTLVGLLDDRYDLHFSVKLIGQIAAASIVSVGGLTLNQLPFFGLNEPGVWISIATSVAFIMTATNAVNFTDGLDGLAAGMVLMTLSVIGLFAYTVAGQDVLLMCLALMGGLIGFLLYNTYPAHVFMGDTGSQFIGFTSAVILLDLTQVTMPTLSPALVLLLLGVPLVDLPIVLAWRLRRGVSPFTADNNHLHHRLCDFGLPHQTAVSVLYGLHVLMLITAVWLRYAPDTVVVAAYVGFVVATVAGLVLLRRYGGTWSRHSFVNSGAERSVGTRDLHRPLLLIEVATLLVAGILLPTTVPTPLGQMAAVAALAFGSLLLIAKQRVLVLRVGAYLVGLILAATIMQSGSEGITEHWLYRFLAFGMVLHLVILYVSRPLSRESLVPSDVLIACVVFFTYAAPLEELLGEQVRIAVLQLALVIGLTEHALARRVSSRLFQSILVVAFLAIATRAVM